MLSPRLPRGRGGGRVERTKLQLLAWKIPENRGKENSRAGSEKQLKRADNKVRIERDRMESLRQIFMPPPPPPRNQALNLETKSANQLAKVGRWDENWQYPITKIKGLLIPTIDHMFLLHLSFLQGCWKEWISRDPF